MNLTLFVSLNFTIDLPYMNQNSMEVAIIPLRIPSLKLNIKLGLFNHLTNPQSPSKSPQNPTPHSKDFYKEKSQCECQEWLQHAQHLG
jgi:hypothetical protein